MLISDDKIPKRLPTMEELPYTDDKPVDSELQDLIAHLLKSILAYIWPYRIVSSDRWDQHKAADASSGKLERLLQKVNADIEANRIKPLDEIFHDS
ncbi:MAG: hypothetical protein F6K35_36900 [Okeania sp. SIO2H7]|nr:hypothetical protein [Okeania sp. SIO2H7]